MGIDVCYKKIYESINTGNLKRYALNGNGVMTISANSEKGLKKLEKAMIQNGQVWHETEEKIESGEYSFYITLNAKDGVSHLFVSTNLKAVLDAEFQKVLNNKYLNRCGEKRVEVIIIDGKITYKASEVFEENDEIENN